MGVTSDSHPYLHLEQHSTSSTSRRQQAFSTTAPTTTTSTTSTTSARRPRSSQSSPAATTATSTITTPAISSKVTNTVDFQIISSTSNIVFASEETINSNSINQSRPSTSTAVTAPLVHHLPQELDFVSSASSSSSSSDDEESEQPRVNSQLNTPHSHQQRGSVSGQTISETLRMGQGNSFQDTSASDTMLPPPSLPTQKKK